MSLRYRSRSNMVKHDLFVLICFEFRSPRCLAPPVDVAALAAATAVAGVLGVARRGAAAARAAARAAAHHDGAHHGAAHDGAHHGVARPQNGAPSPQSGAGRNEMKKLKKSKRKKRNMKNSMLTVKLPSHQV